MASASRLRRAQVFARSSGKCIYCGGIEEADTIDHMPPVVMFSRRHRPKGLEFPSCLACNQGARHADLVAALIGRIFPDGPDPEDAVEFGRLLAAANRDIPGVLEEMQPSAASARLMMRRLGVNVGGALNIGGPLVLSHLEAFGVRLGLAMHFENTGKILPPSAGVLVRVYSNVELFEGELPEDIFHVLPDPETLRQGRLKADDQFLYSCVSTEDGEATMSFASFRLAYGVLAMTTPDRAGAEALGARVFAPGQTAPLPVLSLRAGFRFRAQVAPGR